jgi:hypothetical protein
VVTQKRRGTTLICRANYDTMREILSFMTEECCADVLRGARLHKPSHLFFASLFRYSW